MSDVGQLCVGVIGVGFAGTSHIRALRQFPNVSVTAVAASSKGRAEAAARRLGVPAWYGDYRQLVAATNIDAIHNCTPNYLHAEVNADVLSAGKHLVAEKPLGMDSLETADLVTLSAAADVVTAVCFNYRFYPLVMELRQMLLSGMHGTVHFVHGAYLQDWLLHRSDWNWRLEARKAGRSRAFADIGSHWIDLAQFVTNDQVVAVFGQLGQLYTTRLRPSGGLETFQQSKETGEPYPVDTEDFGSVLLRFASGALGAFNVSQVSAGRRNYLHLEIEAGSSSFAWNQEEPNTLWIGHRDQPNLEIIRDPSQLSPESARFAHLPGGHQEGWLDTLRNLFMDFCGNVSARRQGEEYVPSFASFEDAHQVTQVVEAILESDEKERWIDLKSDQEAKT
jgi:predicted dehydrogenase